MHRLVPTLAAAAALFPAAPLAAAPTVILPVPPPSASNPTNAAIGNAYRAVQAANATNPAAAQQAQFLYQAALERLRAGDTASARADAAMAIGVAGRSQATVVTPVTPGLTGNSYRAPTAPLAVGPGGLLPQELRDARDRIERDDQAGVGSLNDASALYRQALNEYFDGNLPAALQSARAASAAADAAERRSPKKQR